MSAKRREYVLYIEAIADLSGAERQLDCALVDGKRLVYFMRVAPEMARGDSSGFSLIGFMRESAKVPADIAIAARRSSCPLAAVQELVESDRARLSQPVKS